MYGIYGDEDGLFDPEQLERIEKQIGADRFSVSPSASHAVFIDRQTVFIDTLISFLRSGG